jgi:hypothetical protein
VTPLGVGEADDGGLDFIVRVGLEKIDDPDAFGIGPDDRDVHECSPPGGPPRALIEPPDDPARRRATSLDL